MGWCPDCDRPVRIVATGIPIPPARDRPEPLVPFSASYKRIVPHLQRGDDTGGANCPGTGKLI
jgi:hypothetical protein